VTLFVLTLDHMQQSAVDPTDRRLVFDYMRRIGDLSRRDGPHETADDRGAGENPPRLVDERDPGNRGHTQSEPHRARVAHTRSRWGRRPPLLCTALSILNQRLAATPMKARTRAARTEHHDLVRARIVLAAAPAHHPPVHGGRVSSQSTLAASGQLHGRLRAVSADNTGG